MLSPKLLEILHNYWKVRRPNAWLFPGDRAHRAITRDAVGQACAKARDLSGLSKPVTPHSLRHALAVHLLEAGADVPTIQLLLGHRSLATNRPLSAHCHQQGLRHVEPLRALAASGARPAADRQAAILLNARDGPLGAGIGGHIPPLRRCLSCPSRRAAVDRPASRHDGNRVVPDRRARRAC